MLKGVVHFLCVLCWPLFCCSLAGKLQPRASPLLEDTETLYQFAVRRREMCRYSEHTIDSAESASEMVEAVVGGSVDMGMFNASGSVSLEMSRVRDSPEGCCFSLSLRCQGERC
jgi:hypothetical protein